jgi:aspartyl-tRNA(Asn)/glutamyl-tRNA(Gln) amidotransferase subunit B
MENDAGKNVHSGGNASFVDLNRAGTPLIEIVTDPDIRSAEEAAAFMRALRNILLYLGVCDGNMEEGSLRCDANVSIRPAGSAAFGARAEIKNLNSFRNVQRAVDYEIGRQTSCLEDGEALVQETRLYDSVKNITLSMRSKEEAQDYRYFPNPDLAPVHVSEAELARWRDELPELPGPRRERFRRVFGLSGQDAELLTGEKELADFFEAAAALYDSPKRIANLIQGELLRALHASGKTLAEAAVTPANLAELARIVDEGLISSKIAQDVFGEVFHSGASPEALVRAKGLAQISDGAALEAAVREAVAENPAEREAYRGGKTKLLAFFVGQVMKKTRGKANPALVNELLQKYLA